MITRAHPYAPDDEVVDGVRGAARRGPTCRGSPPDNPVASVASGNHAMVGMAGRLGSWRPDVVHAHDWLASWAGDTLRALWEVPFVATVHATEMGRHQGLAVHHHQPDDQRHRVVADLPGPACDLLLVVHGRGGAEHLPAPGRTRST